MSDEFFSQIPGYVFVETGEGGYWSYNPAVAAKQKADAEAEAARLEASKYRPGMKTSDLEQMAKIAPFVTYRTVEGGEGSRQEAISNDPAQLANKLLAQPEKVSADYIRTTYPSLSQLPASVLNQMGQDWRTAYAHLYKATEPSSSGWYGEKQGFVPVPIRLEGGKPFLSTGGGGELFAEALPYVQYSPEYGFGVAQQGVRPYQDKFSLLDAVGAIGPGLAMSAILGPAGFGLSLPAAGAVSGGINALLNEGNIAKGVITGGALGGLQQLVSPEIAGALQSAGITGAPADMLSGAAMGAAKSAVTGGDVMQGALAGAASSAAGSAVKGIDALADLDPAIAKAITSAASGAASAAVTGRDPLEAALNAAATTALKTAFAPSTTTATKTAEAESPLQYAQAQGPTMFDVPMVDVPEKSPEELIDEMLAAQEPISPLAPEPAFETPTESYIDRGGLAVPAQSGLFDIQGYPITTEQYKTFSGPMFDEQGNLTVEAEAGTRPVIPDIEVRGGELPATPVEPDIQSILDMLREQEQYQFGMETALQGSDQALIDALGASESEQSAMEQALQAQFGSGMSDLERQIMEQAAADEADRLAMQKSLEELGGSTSSQIAGLGAGLGKQILDLGKMFATQQQQQSAAQSALNQQIQAAQQQAGFADMLGMLGLMQQGKQQQEAPPPLVGEINPYEFSTDLLEGIYKPASQRAANNQLLNLVRG